MVITGTLTILWLFHLKVLGPKHMPSTPPSCNSPVPQPYIGTSSTGLPIRWRWKSRRLNLVVSRILLTTEKNGQYCWKRMCSLVTVTDEIADHRSSPNGRYCFPTLIKNGILSQGVITGSRSFLGVFSPFKVSRSYRFFSLLFPPFGCSPQPKIIITIIENRFRVLTMRT